MGKTRRPASRARPGHNGGPPLDEAPHVPEWGRGGPGTYFSWRAAYRSAWRSLPREIAVTRAERAEALGLTFEEYTLEILERGRHLGVDDVERIAVIKAGRNSRPRG